MHTKLTSKYYLIRIAKSKDIVDLSDALKAYAMFKKDRSEYAVQQYCQSVRKLDMFGMVEAMLIPAY
jgi:hypothetical protein